MTDRDTITRTRARTPGAEDYSNLHGGAQSRVSPDTVRAWIRSGPYRGANKLAGRTMCEPGSPEMLAPYEADCGSLGSAEPFGSWRRPRRHRCLELIGVELSGVIEDGMSGRIEQRKPGTARGLPRRSRTAKASCISRLAVKSRCAREWGGWGRLSDDGPGQHNRRRQYGWRGPAGERPARVRP